MQEFRDGSFGPIRPAAELADLLRERAEQFPPNNLKAIHFGTVEELERIRKRAAPGGNSSKKSRREARRRLPALERKVADLEARLNQATKDEHREGIRVYPEAALHELARQRHG
jgi:hypothetical protein